MITFLSLYCTVLAVLIGVLTYNLRRALQGIHSAHDGITEAFEQIETLTDAVHTHKDAIETLLQLQMAAPK